MRLRLPSHQALARNDSGSRELGERRPFVPNRQQQRFLNTWLEPDSPDTIKGLAERSGVPRRTIYNWLDDDEFRQWFSEQAERFFGFNRLRMWQKCQELAIRGSPEHIRLCAQRVGELRTEGQGVPTGAGVNNVFINVPRPEFAPPSNIVVDATPAILPVNPSTEEH